MQSLKFHSVVIELRFALNYFSWPMVFVDLIIQWNTQYLLFVYVVVLIVLKSIDFGFTIPMQYFGYCIMLIVFSPPAELWKVFVQMFSFPVTDFPTSVTSFSQCSLPKTTLNALNCSLISCIHPLQWRSRIQGDLKYYDESHDNFELIPLHNDTCVQCC